MVVKALAEDLEPREEKNDLTRGTLNMKRMGFIIYAQMLFSRDVSPHPSDCHAGEAHTKMWLN